MNDGMIKANSTDMIEVLTANGAIFPIDEWKTQAYRHNEKYNLTVKREIPRKALYHALTGHRLGIVGENYHVVNGATIAETVLQPLVDKGLITPYATMVHGGGKKIVVQCRINDSAFKIIDGDEGEMFLWAIYGHDGNTGVTFMVSPVQGSCLNIVPTAIAQSLFKITFKHYREAQDQLSYAEEMITNAPDIFHGTFEQYRKLYETRINQEDFKKFACKALKFDYKTYLGRLGNDNFDIKKLGEARSKMLPKVEMIETIMDMNEFGQGATEYPTWGHAMNAVTRYVGSHRGNKGTTRTFGNLNGEGFHIRQRAMATALEMAL